MCTPKVLHTGPPAKLLVQTVSGLVVIRITLSVWGWHCCRHAYLHHLQIQTVMPEGCYSPSPMGWKAAPAWWGLKTKCSLLPGAGLSLHCECTTVCTVDQQVEDTNGLGTLEAAASCTGLSLGTLQKLRNIQEVLTKFHVFCFSYFLTNFYLLIYSFLSLKQRIPELARKHWKSA